ncbi:MAG TPA: transporter associated domain-containing protein, partial [Gammaproteobacteria bacterium]
LEVPTGSGVIQRVELDVPGEFDRELVGYRLDGESPAAKATRLPLLPEGVRYAAVLRDHQPLDTCDLAELQAGDYVYLLAKHDDLPALDGLFSAAPDIERDAATRYFGEFIINGDARLEDLAQVYGFALPEEVHGHTVTELFATRFGRRQVVGDRIVLGTVELVVRETEGAEVSRAGLKLSH